MVAKSALYVAALAALSMVAVQNASAAKIAVSSGLADGNIYYRASVPDYGNTSGDSGDLLVGVGFPDGGIQQRVGIYVFKLPSLSAGETVTGASFQAYLSEVQTNLASFNVDMYVTRVGSGTTYDYATDFGDGPTPAPVLGTLIQNDFVTPTTPKDALVNTSAAGNTALLNYLNLPGNYVGGSYLFVRLNGDYSNLQNQEWANFMTADKGSQAGSAGLMPTLTLTTVPEPASLALLGLSGLAMLRRRRQA